MKLSVVPESSERCTGVIAVSGRSRSGLSSAMACYFRCGDLVVEDRGDGGRVEVRALHPGQVVDDGDGADVTPAPRSRRRRTARWPRRAPPSSVLSAESEPAREKAPLDEVLAPGAGADRGCSDCGLGVVALEEPARQAPCADSWARRSATVEGAGQALARRRCLSCRESPESFAAPQPLSARASAAMPWTNPRRMDLMFYSFSCLVLLWDLTKCNEGQEEGCLGRVGTGANAWCERRRSGRRRPPAPGTTPP